jgi:hypothetical protein
MLSFFVGDGERFDECVDDGVFEIPILDLFTKNEAVDQKVKLLPISGSSSVSRLAAEDPATVCPLKVQVHDRRVIVREGYAVLPTVFPVRPTVFPLFLASGSEEWRAVAKDVFMHNEFLLRGPDQKFLDVTTEAIDTSAFV